MQKSRTTFNRAAFAAALLVGFMGQPSSARAEAGGETISGLAVRGVTADTRSVGGWVENLTDHEVRDVRLIVQQNWRWTAERHPGDDNPGSATVVSVPDPIPPHARVQFRYDLAQTLPTRSDGSFETSVKILSFSEHWNVQPIAVDLGRPAP